MAISRFSVLVVALTISLASFGAELVRVNKERTKVTFHNVSASGAESKAVLRTLKMARQHLADLSSHDGERKVEELQKQIEKLIPPNVFARIAREGRVER